MTSIARHPIDPDPRRPGPGGGKMQCCQDGGWREDWTVGCPLGHPQRRLTLLGYRLKADACLQIRVVLGGADGGVCQMFIEQATECIYVTARACGDRDEPRACPDTDVGCHVWLDEPLGSRGVVDIDSGVELPWLHLRRGSRDPWLYVPRPAGELWPSDGLEELDLDELELLAARVPRQVQSRPSKRRGRPGRPVF